MQKYLDMGYSVGKLKVDGPPTAWVNDGNTTKKIKLSDVDIHLNQGWKRGRIMDTKKKING